MQTKLFLVGKPRSKRQIVSFFNRFMALTSTEVSNWNFNLPENVTKVPQKSIAGFLLFFKNCDNKSWINNFLQKLVTLRLSIFLKYHVVEYEYIYAFEYSTYVPYNVVHIDI